MIPVDELKVIDTLEIGPVRVEPRRVTTRYTVITGRRRDSIDLVYRYEEDVFDESVESTNLAAMTTAQIALNYGLFCDRMVFRGAFDERDRKFLERFAENTAREIYVNKLLKPNPFLTGPATEVSPERRPSYLQADLRIEPEQGPASAGGWSVDPARHAVLSSGGKDSLLTFGLLREMQLDPHPIFVNESGRHWYTALNAYRHLQSTDPRTARVWTNSDRVFAWMLRHLPFVRADFSRVRSDAYPIRLWTVAVFVFGALPLLRARGLGRLLIGNEFDTTTRAKHRGVPHYDGLYDQSRFFDEELTRWYGRKGWNVCQFSVLRTMSELLIEKVLAERYPDLFEHQTSCHATHIEGDRAYPCGACEKCRRVVAMLVALGQQPERLGYTAPQVRHCLGELAGKGVHQEPADASHLAHMLTRRGLFEARSGGFPAREHPATVQLRFDRRRSPAEGVPADLRAGLYRRLLEHADGAVVRSGRVWKPFDPLVDEVLARCYPFARARSDAAVDGNRFLLAELTWPEAEDRFKQVDVALLPVGAVEQHGPHLPLDTDAFDADYLARRVAEACPNPKPLVLPAVAYGVSYHHRDFSGTLSVGPDTLARFIHEIGMSAARCGVTKLVIINGHGGNAPALHLAAQMINRDAHIFTCVDTGETSDHDVHQLLGAENDVHAGEIETSTTLAVRPSLVKMDLAQRTVPRFSSSYLDFTSTRSVGWYAYTEKISSSGVIGDPTRATAEKGKQIWDVMTRRLVELVEDLKGLSLDEIYQRRY